MECSVVFELCGIVGRNCCSVELNCLDTVEMSGVKGIGKQPEDTKAEDTTTEGAPIHALKLECVGSGRGAGIHETIEGVGDDLSGLACDIELACADMTPLTAAAAASAAATASFITCANEWSLITRANKGCV